MVAGGLSKTLGDQMDNADKMITIALEQIDSQLKLLGLEKTPDALTQEVSRRLREVLQSSQPSADTDVNSSNS